MSQRTQLEIILWLEKLGENIESTKTPKTFTKTLKHQHLLTWCWKKHSSAACWGNCSVFVDEDELPLISHSCYKTHPELWRKHHMLSCYYFSAVCVLVFCGSLWMNSASPNVIFSLQFQDLGLSLVPALTVAIGGPMELFPKTHFYMNQLLFYGLLVKPPLKQLLTNLHLFCFQPGTYTQWNGSLWRLHYCISFCFRF